MSCVQEDIKLEKLRERDSCQANERFNTVYNCQTQASVQHAWKTR